MRHLVPWVLTPSLARKGLIIVAIPLAFEIAFAGVVFTLNEITRRDYEAELRAKEIAESAHRLTSLLVDAETGIRGYILTRNPQFTEPFHAAVHEAPLELKRLRTLASGLDAQVELVADRARPILQYHSRQQALVAAGRADHAAASTAAGTGRRLMEAFRSSMTVFLDEQESLERSRFAARERTRRLLIVGVAGGLLLNVSAAGAVAWYFTTNIARRVAVVVENTERLEAGRELLPPQKGTDEIAGLDVRFHQMAKALQRSRTELEAANQELESFSYSVSHDLRAPLRAVMGYGRMLDDEYSSRLDDQGRRFLSVITGEASRMGQLIDDLLAFSRLGRNPLQVRDVDVMEIAREVLAEVAGDDRDRIDVTFQPAPPACADPRTLRQVLVNLLSNAIKFSSRRERIPIEIGGSHQNGENVYWVRDQGVGFDMRYADKLFGVFQRLHAAGEFEGTGVGLAIVQRVINRHGGRVWADSSPGAGASFFFTLPAVVEAGDE